MGTVAVLDPPSPESSGALVCKPALSGKILESDTVCVPLEQDFLTIILPAPFLGQTVFIQMTYLMTFSAAKGHAFIV